MLEAYLSDAQRKQQRWPTRKNALRASCVRLKRKNSNTAKAESS